MNDRAAWLRAAAVGVHVLTLSGAALALAALIAAGEKSWVAAFAFLGAAMIVDAVDGPLARRIRIGELLPRWRGEILDQIVDYLTYVFVPAYIAYAASLVPHGLNFAVAALICITAGFHFADRRNKTEDNFFLGFPAVWNVIVFYLAIFAPAPALSLAVILVCAAATFAPLRFVHPLRVARLRPVTLAVTAIWTIAAVSALLQDLRPDLWVRLGLLLTASYFLGLSALRASALRRNR